MERLTDFELEQVDNQLINDGTNIQIRKLVDEVKEYRQLEKEIGCPLKVKCNLCEGRIIYFKNGKSCHIAHLDKNTFVVVDNTSDHTLGFLYYKDYGKDWFLKADRSE